MFAVTIPYRNVRHVYGLCLYQLSLASLPRLHWLSPTAKRAFYAAAILMFYTEEGEGTF